MSRKSVRYNSNIITDLRPVVDNVVSQLVDFSQLLEQVVYFDAGLFSGVVYFGNTFDEAHCGIDANAG